MTIGGQFRRRLVEQIAVEILVTGHRPGNVDAVGALARDQQKGGGCDAKLTYGNAWADRLPAAFKVYPRATLREAAGVAGVAGGKCNIRVVNFQTAASIQGVLDYYHTLAIRNGYTSDHRVNGNEHMIGGTKGDLALKLTDTYHAFRGQLVAFIDMLHTGQRPLPFDETVELMAVIIAGIRSREQGGALITISDILTEL